MKKQICEVKINDLKDLQNELALIRNALSNMENKITDLYAPLPKPKKGWASFRTSRGFVSFKLRKERVGEQ